MSIYNFRFEIVGNGPFEGKNFKDTVQVKGDTEEHARAYAEQYIEDNFPGSEDWQLLELVLVSVLAD